jgi:hypothetical protein
VIVLDTSILSLAFRRRRRDAHVPPQVAALHKLIDDDTPLDRLMRKYASVPMSLVDACLVRMAELSAESVVLTLDHDFRPYRKSGWQVVPVIMDGS